MIKVIANAYRDAFRGLPREVWYLAVAMFINRSGSMVLPFLSLYVNKELGCSEFLAANTMTVFGVGSVIGSLWGGYASERWGPIRVQIFALLVNAVGFASLSLMPNFISFALLLFPIGVLAEMFRPANLAAITLLCPAESHKRAFALNRLAINLGVSIGPPVGGFLAVFNFQWIFWLDGATCLGAAVAIYILLHGHHADLLRRSAATGTESRQNPYRDSAFMAFVFLSIACFAVFFQLMSIYPLFLTDEYHLNLVQIGILFALNPVIVVAVEMVLVNRIGHWNQLRTIAWGSLLICVGFGVLPFGYGFGYAVFTLLIWTLGEMLMMPQAMTHVAARSDENSRGRYIGVYTAGVSIAFILGPLLGSIVYSIDHMLFEYIALGVGVIALIGFYLVERMEAAEETDEPIEALPDALSLVRSDSEAAEVKS